MLRIYSLAFLLFALLSACGSDDDTSETDLCTDFTQSTQEAEVLLINGDWTWTFTLTIDRTGEIRETPENTGVIRTLSFASDGTGTRTENDTVVSEFNYTITSATGGVLLLQTTNVSGQVNYELEVCANQLILTDGSTSLRPEEHYIR